MLAAKVWLPAAADGAIEIAIGKLIEQWASEWFVCAAPVALQHAPVRAGRQWRWRKFDGLMVGTASGELARLGLAICNGEGEPDNPRDKLLLEKLGEKACAHFAGLLGADPEANVGGSAALLPENGLARYMLVCTELGWSVVIALDNEALTKVRRNAAIGGPVPQLGSFAAALENEQCTVAVHLGRAQLSTGELAAIGIGDVIQLDRKTQDPAPLVIAGSHPEEGSAHVERQGPDLRLTLATTISMNARETVPA